MSKRRKQRETTSSLTTLRALRRSSHINVDGAIEDDGSIHLDSSLEVVHALELDIAEASKAVHLVLGKVNAHNWQAREEIANVVVSNPEGHVAEEDLEGTLGGHLSLEWPGIAINLIATVLICLADTAVLAVTTASLPPLESPL